MVTTPVLVHRRLFARDDGDSSGSDGDSDDGQGEWGPLQIATPAIVAAVLLLFFIVYIVWQRSRLTRKREYNCNKRIRQASAPMTLHDSMRPPRLYHSNSSDSQTPLTATNCQFDFAPNPKLSDSPPNPKRRAFRWWWLFGSRPKEIKPQDPSSRWRVDGPDGSSTGHGQSNHGHDERRARYLGYLAAMREDPDEVDGGIGSTPMVQRSPLPEQARSPRGTPPVPAHPGSIVPRSPILVVSAHSGSIPGPSVNRGLPPSYDISQTHALAPYPSAEEAARLAPPESRMVSPPLRTAAYASPRGFHGRELSSDSVLAAQAPMAVATTLY